MIILFLIVFLSRFPYCMGHVFLFFFHTHQMNRIIVPMLLCAPLILAGCSHNANIWKDDDMWKNTVDVQNSNQLWKMWSEQEKIPPKEMPKDKMWWTPAMNKNVVSNEKGYVVYDPTTVEKAAKEWKKVVLFFHASRCPSCRNLDSNIRQNVSQIPEDAIIYQVDYDTYSELKKMYGVRTQHTLVYLNSDLSMRSSSVWGQNIADILKNIQ
jgi:thiol-disulfide isomerase/thioredoxin